MPESHLADVYTWEENWRLPRAFKSKKEFKIFLGMNDYVLITDEHYSDRHGRHLDILQYSAYGKVKSKLHCGVDDDFGNSFEKCLRQLLLKS